MEASGYDIHSAERDMSTGIGSSLLKKVDLNIAGYRPAMTTGANYFRPYTQTKTASFFVKRKNQAQRRKVPKAD